MNREEDIIFEEGAALSDDDDAKMLKEKLLAN